MPPLLRYTLRRLISIPVSLFIVTFFLYAIISVTPPETRASLYFPPNLKNMSEKQFALMVERIIKSHHLNDPFPVQYVIWVGTLVKGEWGYSPTLQEEVLVALLRRTPVTAELTIYSILTFIPLGLIAGSLAGWQRGKPWDRIFRFTAFTGTSLPPFVLAILLLAIFYVSFYVFPPERLSTNNWQFIQSSAFKNFTGFVTLDGLLNGRLDITLDAFRHMVLPIVTLGYLHWSTLGRVARVATLEELQKEYITAARSRGIPERTVVWKHTLRNILSPALTSSALSAASLFTGVFVVERVFVFNGVSDMILSVQNVADAPAVLGFSVYAIMIVLLIMFLLDMLQAIFDPRIRESLLDYEHTR
jgi:peptide/nickel transport system permease protein